MNKRIFLFTIALVGTMLTAIAQEVTTVHLKNGDKLSYLSNVKKPYTSLEFWDYQTDTVVNHDYSPNPIAKWETISRVHANRQYCMMVYWLDELPSALGDAAYGICFGNKPELSVDNSDTVAYYNKENTAMKDRKNYLETYEHYMLIGPSIPSTSVPYYLDRYPYNTNYMSPYSITVNVKDTLTNFIKHSLEYGKTYYYRTFTKGMVWKDGKAAPTYFYGSEKSFRVPYVMSDAGYYNYPRPTDEALETFGNKYFQNVEMPEWEQLENLWFEWLDTEEGSKMDLSADITSAEFDDGTGYRLNRIPDEFYTWLSNREIVIDPLKGLESVSSIEINGESVKLAKDSLIIADEKWGIPDNKYVRFTPETYAYSLTYRSNENIPGVRYKLQFVFAPETLYEQTEENQSEFLPTLLRIRALTTVDGKEKTTTLFNSEEISAQQVTTLTLDEYSVPSMGLGFVMESRVSSSQIRNNLYNRIVRIACIRLVPIKESAD